MPDYSDGQALYVMFADIDYFKSINDHFGHLEGDHALCHVAEALRTVCRSANAYPARFGGDEFVIVFRSDDDRGAASFRREVQDTVFARSEGLPYRLSLSAGYARRGKEDSNPSLLLERADEQLYEEKRMRPSREFILRMSDDGAKVQQSEAAR
jgi:diguanylate cyclase (GGDEF)-like protein